jgi:HK97 gp10 family phage protein
MAKRRYSKSNNQKVIKQFNKVFEGNIKQLEEIVDDAMDKGLEFLIEESPEDTRYMKSVEYSEKTGKTSFKVMSPAYYSSYVNDGTEHQEANPYVERAFNRTVDYIEHQLDRKF